MRSLRPPRHSRPDGTFQLQADTLPVRTKKDGTWVPIDESLVKDGSGMLAPQAAEVPVRFAVGGSDVLDEVQTSSGAWISESWPFGTLPAPTVSGRTATYADAIPGVDVRLTATASGMSSVLIVKNASAAADPRLQSFRLSDHGASESAAPLDSMVAKVADGSSVTAGSPLWWDSADGGTADGPGGNNSNRPVSHTADSHGLTLDVGKTIAGKSVRYPIYIDPDWSSGVSASWYTDVAYPDQSYLYPSQSDVLRVGNYAQWNSHMFFEFPIGALSGKQVIAASLATTQLSIDACPTNAIALEVYGPQAAGFTWNQESGTWWGVAGVQTPGSCSDPGATIPVGWTVTEGVQAEVGNGLSVVQFGIVQNSAAQSRRHFDRAATLYVNYDTPPNTPTTPQFATPSRTCATSPSAPVAFNGNQTMTAQVNETDPDGGNVADDFFLQDVTTGTQLLKYTTPMQSGPTISWSYNTSSLINGHEYAWRAQGSDYQYVSSGLSSWCYFTIDNTAPVGPSVSMSATSLTIGVGVPVSISSAGAPDVAGYEYWIARSPATAPAAPIPVPVSLTVALPTCPSQQGAANFVCAATTSVTVAPIDDRSVLWVASYDAAGNVSAASPLSLTGSGGTSAALAGTPSFHSWPMNALTSPYPSMIADSNTSSATDTTGQKNLSVGSGTSWVTGTVQSTANVPMLSFAGTASTAALVSSAAGIAGAAIDTTKSFTASAWVKPAATTGTMTILAQSGASKSGFLLEDAGGTMNFCVQPQTGSGGPDCAVAPTGSPAGTWVMVTGIWDATNHQARIVLGNVAQESVAAHVPPSGDTSASGAVTVGSAEAGAAPVNAWNGTIESPLVVQEILGSSALKNLYSAF